VLFTLHLKMKFLVCLVSIAPSLSFVHLKTSAFTPTLKAVTNQPVNENWQAPDLLTKQDLGHAHGDQSARALEVTDFSRSPSVPHSGSQEISENGLGQSTPSGFPGFSHVALAESASELGSASIENPQLAGTNYGQAKQQLDTAKDKVSRLRDELRSRSQQHESMAQQLKNELRTQEESLSNRNALLTKEFEDYKIQAHEENILLREEIDTRETQVTKNAEDRRNVLRGEIRGLETKLGTARSEVESAKMRAASITIQRNELKKTLTEMNQRYNVDSKEWEGLLDQEQASWQKEQASVGEVMHHLMNEHGDRLNQEQNNARIKAESIRSELRNQLFEKEVLLQKTEVALRLTELEEKDLEEKVNQMELEKEDLVSLGRQSISVLRKGFLDAMAGKDKGV